MALSGGGDDDNGSGNGNGNDNGNGNGNGDNGDLPDAPANLTATAAAEDQIDLAWTAPANNGGSAITGYQIEYKEGNGDWMDAAADTGTTDTDYAHSGLTAETEYSYRVSAINAIGTGTASNVVMATTVAQADDPKPGVPTGLTATPGDGEVTLSWTDPQYCGSGDLCSATTHEHYLEYKLTSASAWGNGAVVAGNPHATTHTVPGLTGGMSYDFRLAVQLSDETDRGPWAEVSAQPQSPSSTFSYTCPKGMAAPGAASSQDTVKCSSCETGYALNSEMCEMDSDGDNMPDSIDPDDDNDGIADTGDAFPMDPCASVDSDGDGDPDTIIAPGDSDMDACTVASPLAEDSDDDNDGTADIDDVDDDNDGLIEIASRAELENLRHNLAGSSYDDEEADSGTGDSGDTTGAPTTEPANCSDVDTDGSGDPANDTVLLCGYELVADIDLQGSDSNRWSPIGGQSNGFSAILEGNGHTLSNLYIRGDTTDADVLGLFASLNGATVRNVTLSEIDIQALYAAGDPVSGGDENRIGALAGRLLLDAATLILNVGVSDSDSDIDLQGAATSDSQYIGGLVGHHEEEGSYILASWATVAVSGGTGDDNIGGLVGWQSGTGITSSYATGAVSGGAGDDSVGGLVGRQNNADIVSSYATGAVSGGAGDDRVGGLVGFQIARIVFASFATGSVDGGSDDSNVGKLIGSQSNFPDGGIISTVTASYGFGATTGSSPKGGGVDGDPPPMGVTAAIGLTATNAGSEWLSSVWDFGDSAQIPALKYISGYTLDSGADNMWGTSDDRHTYSCDSSLLPPAASVTCGATLLAGQR